MKSTLRVVFLLLLAALPLSLFSQGQTVVAAYMKVTTDNIPDYLEVEQGWKKYHEAAVANGLHNGWQLWRRLHVGEDDPYQFITLQYYDNYAQTFGVDVPDNWLEGVYTDEEWSQLYEKTLKARVYAFEQVANLITMVDNPQAANFLVIHRMKVLPGMGNEYVRMETEIFKPYHEVLINKGALATWALWNIWPYKQGECRYVTVNGYKDAAQLTADGVAVTPEELGLDYTMEEIMELAQKTREMVQDELWVLVDSVFPKE